MSAEHEGVRLVANDALMLQFEDASTHFHTLKIVHLDPARLGRQVTLDDLVSWVPRYLDVTPRLRQRIVRRSYRHWYWVHDPDLDVRRHLDERTVADHAGLDALCGELAGTKLDPDRPRWALTLVHGLPGGRQAVVARIHHAIMDGSAAMNAFTAVSAAEPGAAPPVPVGGEHEHVVRRSAVGNLVALARAGRQSRKRTKAFGPAQEVPRAFLWRTRVNPRTNGPSRVCASRPIPETDLQELATFLGAGVNGAFHATLALAFRQYRLRHGDVPKQSMVANFGVAEDVTSPRCDGNKLATARLWLRVDDDDPLSLARRTAASTLQTVALRRERGFEFQRVASEYVWVIPMVRTRVVNLPPVTPVHTLTAYVRGSRTTRWFGDVEVTGFVSYAVSLAPTDPSFTAYRYAGSLWLGLVVTPQAIPDPAAFLDEFESALATLVACARDANAAEAAGSGA